MTADLESVTQSVKYLGMESKACPLWDDNSLYFCTSILSENSGERGYAFEFNLNSNEMVRRTYLDGHSAGKEGRVLDAQQSKSLIYFLRGIEFKMVESWENAASTKSLFHIGVSQSHGPVRFCQDVPAKNFSLLPKDVTQASLLKFLNGFMSIA